MICIVHHLYQFSQLLIQCWVKDAKNGSSEHSEIRSGRHGKTGCYCSCIRDDQRVSY